ncbi:MAG: winged helix-turn-helix transcriptional regulator [Anaerolineales bacterium]|uniref:Winged helix-turn-helix transcriptional regulator n=1 Tax=Candidatus Desulfolinea nitratireducens TaxID=2841698 RepID=A0A8J6NG62_9CHLR|nr:winged helix-turn-helix transcriptional regulator [Candidatus Desulfolinea nitratireducens]MBL6960718.1 winged helix-turn-helix transcriptional regulator [Anaerolineales bacterium]
MKNLGNEINQLHADLCSALAEPNRLFILYALSEKSCNVTELTKLLEVPQPTTSRHLKTLRERGLVYAERQGSNIIYHLADKRLIEALDLLRTVLSDRLTHRASLVQG